MASFNTFFISSVTNKKNVVQQDVGNNQWDVVLFVGDYNPINKYEHERIKEFVKTQVQDKSKHQFNKNTEVGLLCNYQFEDENDKLLDKFKFNLSLSDKEYLAARLFGLKLFPINLQDLMLFAASSDEDAENQETTTKIFGLFSEIFENSNILIVLRPEDEPILGKLEHIVEQSGVKIGFTVWQYEPSLNVEFLDSDGKDGNIIKATVLMDQYRPFPEDLKAFAYKHKLGDYLQEIRNIHLKVAGEKYIVAFMGLFPNISMNEESSEKISNYYFIMELLKKMYLGPDYKNVSALNKFKQDNTAMPAGLGSSGGGAGGPSGSADAGSGDSMTPDTNPTQGEEPPTGETGPAGAPDTVEEPKEPA